MPAQDLDLLLRTLYKFESLETSQTTDLISADSLVGFVISTKLYGRAHIITI